MPKTEIIEAAAAALPALYADNQGGSADIEMPKVYLQADLSALVKARITEPGDVILALTNDDIDPTWLIGGDEGNDTYRAFILARKRFVIRDVGQGEPWEYLPDDYQRQPDDRDVWIGYNYLVSIPSASPLLPARHMFVKTAGNPVYKKINTFLEIANVKGSRDPVCVEFGTTVKHNKKGIAYHAFTVKQVPDPDPDELAIAKQHHAQFAAGFNRAEYTEAAGPVVDTPDF